MYANHDLATASTERTLRTTNLPIPTLNLRIKPVVLVLALLSILLPWSPSLAHAGSATKYRVVAIAPTSAASFSTAINSAGEVIGQMGGTNPVPFVYRAGKLVRLIAPRGLSDVQALALNDSGTIAVQAQGPSGRSLAFAVRPNRGRFVWSRLALAGFDGADVSVSGVASNGDIDGTVTLVSPGGTVDMRSVIWRVTPGYGYRPAQVLPVSAGFTSTLAGGIWRRRGETYVAGAEATPSTHVQDASLWSPEPALEAVPGEQLFTSAIGGTGDEVYAVGTMRSSTFQAWAAKLAFGPGGRAGLDRMQALPPVAGYDESVAVGVSVDAAGLPVTVGDVLSTLNSRTSAVVWTGDRSASLLQSDVGVTPWTITEAGGINAKGEIAAAGTYKGSLGALILVPKG